MPLNILCIEDSVADRRLIREFLKTDGAVHFAVDGAEGLDFLYHRSPFERMKRPDLILLDLNLPKKSGHEVLAEIKSDPDLRRIPVVILSSSQDADDITHSYDARANCYLVKPDELDQFEKVMTTIKDFWVDTVRVASQVAH